MDRIDFNNNPAGFPLEADSILGFMQTAIHDALTGLAEMSANGFDAILSGCTKTGNTVSDGWIFYNGEIYFFQGGTEQANFIITETVVQKANENGTLVDRIFTRKAQFGTGAGQISWDSLYRINSIYNIGSGLNNIANTESAFDWVILRGCNPIGSNGIGAGAGMYKGIYINIPSYTGATISEANPVYLTPNATWTISSDPSYLKFEPYTNRRMEALQRKASNPVGSVTWQIALSNELTTFFTAGLGKYDWDGWAVADGNNGTNDLVASVGFANPVPVQRIP